MKFFKKIGAKVNKALAKWDEKDTTEKIVTTTITTAVLATSGFLIVKFYEEIFAIVALGIVAVVLAFSNGYGLPSHASEQTLDINIENLHEAIIRGLENVNLLRLKLGNDVPPYHLDFTDANYIVISHALFYRGIMPESERIELQKKLKAYICQYLLYNKKIDPELSKQNLTVKLVQDRLNELLLVKVAVRKTFVHAL